MVKIIPNFKECESLGDNNLQVRIESARVFNFSSVRSLPIKISFSSVSPWVLFACCHLFLLKKTRSHSSKWVCCADREPAIFFVKIFIRTHEFATIFHFILFYFPNFSNSKYYIMKILSPDLVNIASTDDDE